MPYTVYFHTKELSGDPTDAALQYTVPDTYGTEAEAIAMCRHALTGRKRLPVALDKPDGTRLNAQQIRDLCAKRPK
jgi:hypothetical protein